MFASAEMLLHITGLLDEASRMGEVGARVWGCPWLMCPWRLPVLLALRRLLALGCSAAGSAGCGGGPWFGVPAMFQAGPTSPGFPSCRPAPFPIGLHLAFAGVT